jgi:hypothetical protein
MNQSMKVMMKLGRFTKRHTETTVYKSEFTGVSCALMKKAQSIVPVLLEKPSPIPYDRTVRTYVLSEIPSLLFNRFRNRRVNDERCFVCFAWRVVHYHAGHF